MPLIGYEHDGIKLKGFPLFVMVELLPNVLVWLGQLIKVCCMCIVQEHRLCNCFTFSMQPAILMYKCFVIVQVWERRGWGVWRGLGEDVRGSVDGVGRG